MSHGQGLPEVVDKSPEEINQIIDVIKKSDLPDSTKSFAISYIRLAIWLPNALLKKKISIFNLHKLIFGGGQSKQRRRKKDKVNSYDGDIEKKDPEPANDNTLAEPSPDSHDDAVTEILFRNIDSDRDKEENDIKPRGHGRNSHEVYTNAIEHNLTIDGLSVGSYCPTECGGKLYQYKPGVLVRIKGQDWASVHKYYIEKLRCNLCGELISASISDDIGADKYDASFKASLVIQKYYIAK